MNNIQKYPTTDPLVKDNKFIGSFWQWIWREFQNWAAWAYVLEGFGVGFQTCVYVLKPITWQTTISFIACLFGQTCTIAMASGGHDYTGHHVASHAINGYLGAISVIGYCIINFVAGHWFSILDQLCFFFLIDIPLMLNWRAWGQGKNNKVKSMDKKKWIYTIIAILCAWAVLYFAGIVLKDTNPIWDSLVLSFGAVASWLCYRQYSGTYILWLCENVVNLGLWFTTVNQGLTSASLSMLIMTIFYFSSDVLGLFHWRPSMNSDN